MDNKRERILRYAWRRFTEAGFTHVTMDEIARGCGVGKATVYQMFGSKEALLLESIESFTCEVKSKMEAVLADNGVPPEKKLEALLEPLFTLLSHIRAETIEDIRRSVPRAYELIEKRRRELIFSNITRVVAEGQRSGVFRADINPALAAHIAIGAVSHAVDPDVLVSLDITPAQTIREIAALVVRGCLIRP